MFQLQLTRTEAGATFEVFRGTTGTGPTTLVYSLDHTTPETEFDEFAIFSQNARTYWLDNLSVSTGNVSAVPEPSTYGALAGALVLGLVAWRRRNT
ncbi:MAG: PEP-CTERM sorting domain-containing protein [Opitutae bacterium]|nr:PEP-CTERM sorting domain-containing protein [Opitutae bacterium]